jgi:CheY-like chemotaxis protein
VNRPALIVDDDHDSCRILGALLPRVGLDPVVVSDGVAAIGLARSRPFALLISELYMPTAEVRCFVQAAKREPALAQVPLLVYSAHCTEADMLWAAECGCEGFLAKPARWSELEPAITRLLADRPLS